MIPFNRTPFNMIGYLPNPAQFLPNSIHFYNPISGNSDMMINLEDQMYITSVFNQNGVNVSISGSKKDVEKVLNKLKDRSVENEILNDINNFSGKTNKTSRPNKITNGYSYQINPRDRNNVLLVCPDGKRYSGSGIILLEKNNNEFNVILAKTKRKLFEDFGGNLDSSIIESSRTLQENAIKELAEESHHLFWIEDLNLDEKINGIDRYVDIRDPTGSLFRCYFICISGLENQNIQQFYDNNRSIIVNQLGYTQQQYIESIAINKFNLNKIREQPGYNGNLNISDTSGNNQIIRDRTVLCLQSISPQILKAVCANAIQLKKTSNKNTNALLAGSVLVDAIGMPLGLYNFIF